MPQQLALHVADRDAQRARRADDQTAGRAIDAQLVGVGGRGALNARQRAVAVAYAQARRQRARAAGRGLRVCCDVGTEGGRRGVGSL